VKLLNILFWLVLGGITLFSIQLFFLHPILGNSVGPVIALLFVMIAGFDYISFKILDGPEKHSLH
jgi:hypothetical protein